MPIPFAYEARKLTDKEINNNLDLLLEDVEQSIMQSISNGKYSCEFWVRTIHYNILTKHLKEKGYIVKPSPYTYTPISTNIDYNNMTYITISWNEIEEEV